MREIAALNNLPFETAEKYYCLIGHTPDLAEDGRVVVYDESGKELAPQLEHRKTDKLMPFELTGFPHSLHLKTAILLCM